MENGCYPSDQPLVLDSVHAPVSGALLEGEFTVHWNVSDGDGTDMRWSYSTLSNRPKHHAAQLHAWR